MGDDQVPIGSDAWLGDADWAPEYAARIRYVRDTLDTDALLARASSIRNGSECRLLKNFSVGTRNLVLQIVFEDDESWIARMRLPPIERFDENGLKKEVAAERDHGFTDADLYEMQSEVDTMAFVRMHTDIPLPQVRDHDFKAANKVGFPYSLIDYIHGNTAEELSARTGHLGSIPPEHASKLCYQMAKVMVKLANVRVPKIGSLVRSATDPEHFDVGPLASSGLGPYDSEAEFFDEYPAGLARHIYGETWADGVRDGVIRAFYDVAEDFRCDRGPTRGGFGLANCDFGGHNVLMDDAFNIVGVIDWDAVVALPDALVHRFPLMLSMHLCPPGIEDDLPTSGEFARNGLEFAEAVERASSDLAADGPFNENFWALSKEGFFAQKAVAFAGLEFFKGEQDLVDEMWVAGLKWMKERAEEEVSGFYAALGDRVGS